MNVCCSVPSVSWLSWLWTLMCSTDLTTWMLSSCLMVYSMCSLTWDSSQGCTDINISLWNRLGCVKISNISYTTGSTLWVQNLQHILSVGHFFYTSLCRRFTVSSSFQLFFIFRTTAKTWLGPEFLDDFWFRKKRNWFSSIFVDLTA